MRASGGPVLHVATFPLHASDGDYGAAATGRMSGDDVFAALLEFRDPGRIHPGTGLFGTLGQPLPEPQAFSARQLQVTRPRQFGWQRFFTAESRASCLYAVVQLGSARIETLVGVLRPVLATIERTSAARP